MKFKSYADVENKLYDEVYFWNSFSKNPSGVLPVFLKLDGANTSIWLHDDGTIHYGSRNNDLTNSENEFRGFAGFVKGNEHVFGKLFSMHPNWILYGEWLVKHTIRYPVDKLNRWYCFDVREVTIDRGDPNDPEVEASRWVPFDEYSLEFARLAQIPSEWILYPICLVKTREEAEDILETFCKGDNRPFLGEPHEEGIVVKNYDYMNRYHGEHLKIKIEMEHLPKVVKEAKEVNPEAVALASLLIDQYCTPVILEKNFQKVIDHIDGKAPRMNEMGLFLKVNSEDVIKDIKHSEQYEAFDNKDVKGCFGKLLVNKAKAWFIQKISSSSP